MTKERQKKNNVKSVAALCLATLAVFCLLCTCAPPAEDDEGDASVTITIGGGSRGVLDSSIDITQLDHTITMTNGSGANVEKTGVKTGQTVQFVVTPGHWDISVKAYFNGRLVAEGSASVNLRRGRNGAVPITMRQYNASNGEGNLVGIEITNQPFKRDYYIGEVLNTTGMVVTAHYSDGTSQVVTDYSVSELDSSTLGNKIITVTWQGKETTFTVNVINPNIPTVATPTASPSAGHVAANTAVTLSTATQGAVIWYTTDGSLPTKNSSRYTSEIIITPPVTIKAFATLDDMNDSGVLEVVYTVTPITAADIYILPPSKGEAPTSAVSGEEDERFIAGTVTWDPADDVFLGDKTYTATVKLTAKPGFTFTETHEVVAKINGSTVIPTHNLDGTITLSYTWTTDERAIKGLAITSSTQIKLNYTHGGSLDLTGLEVTLTYDTGETDVVALDGPNDKNIISTPSHGVPLVYSEHNGKKVVISAGRFTIDAGTLIISQKSVADYEVIVDSIPDEPYTGNEIKPAVNVTHHVTETIRELVQGTDYNLTYENNTDAGTANVTISGIGDYTSSKTVNFKIKPKTVTIFTIPGVNVPAFNRAPDTTIEDTAQYTGTVAWSPSLTSNKFAYGTKYTATITLNLKDNVNYTFEGVTENSFFVAGASSVSNTANSGVVNAVFPEAPFNIVNSDDWSAAKAEIIRLGSGTSTNVKTYTIYVTESFATASNTDTTFGNVTYINVTITGNKTITLTGTGNLLRLGANQTVVIHDTDFEGNKDNNTSLIVLDGSNRNLTMEGNSSVFGNKGNNGGGVYAGATFIMQDDAEVYNNTATNGGGVYVNSGTFTMEGNSSVHDNTVTSYGGGVLVSAGTFNMKGGIISINNAPTGGGVYVSSSAIFNMEKGIIYGTDADVNLQNNASSGNGAALYSNAFNCAQRGTFNENTFTRINYLGNTNYTLNVAKGILPDVVFNVASDNDWNNAINRIKNGGSYWGYIINVTSNFYLPGVSAETFGTVTNINVTITGDYTITLANNSTGYLLYLGSGPTVIIHDTDFEGNSGNNSPLIYLYGSPNNLTMEGNSSVFGNKGGGVNVRYGTFIMQDNASVYGNTDIGTGGGGVYVGGSGSSGTFTMKDNASVYGNTSTYNGGGVYVYSSSTFRIENGTVYGSNETDPNLKNTANNGAALYNSGTAQRGTFTGTNGAWSKVDDLVTTNNTIRVVDGEL